MRPVLRDHAGGWHDDAHRGTGKAGRAIPDQIHHHPSLTGVPQVSRKLVDQVAAVNLPTKYGDFSAYGFVSRLNGEHHIALVKGDIGDGKDILCRVHSECLTGDTFGSLRCDCGQQLAAAMTQIEKRGPGYPALYAAGRPRYRSDQQAACLSVAGTGHGYAGSQSRSWVPWG